MNQKVHRKGAPPAWRDPKTGYTKEKICQAMRGKNGKSEINQGKEKLQQMEMERLYQNSLHIFKEVERRTFMNPNIRSIFCLHIILTS